MLKINEEIEHKDLDASILLQIHDELLFEIEQKQASLLAASFAKTMEEIYPLRVALTCSVAIGQRWGALK